MESQRPQSNREEKSNENVRNLIVLVLALQVFIMLSRIVAGIFLHNSVLLLEGFHVLIDLTITSTVLITLKVIEGEYAKKFSYGLYKLDDLVSFIISIIVAFSAFDIAINSIKPEGLLSIYPATIQIATIIPLAAAGILKIKAGKILSLGSLVEDGRHTYADVYEGLGVGIGLALFSITRQLLFYYISIAIAVIAILITAYEIGKGSVISLLDLPKDENLMRQVRDEILHDRDVESLKDLRLRWSGPVIFGEVVITVKPTLTIIDAHEIADRLEKTIYLKFKDIRNISIHIEPSVKGIRKVLIPMDGESISHKVSRAEYFLIYNPNDLKLMDRVENKASSKYGKNLVEICERFGVTDLICHEIGENSKVMLKGLGIRIWLTKGNKPEEVLQEFINGKLEIIF